MLICCVNVLQQEAKGNCSGKLESQSAPINHPGCRGSPLPRENQETQSASYQGWHRKVMQSGSSVPEGPRHWIKIKPLSLFLLHWGHWEGKDVINQAINLTPGASSFGFLPCSFLVMQGRGWHPGPPCPCMESPPQAPLFVQRES